MNKFKKGQTVIVLKGKDKGKTGKILEVFPKDQKVIVENVNMIKKHMKRTQESAGKIAELTAPIFWSKIAIYDKKSKSPVRVKFEQSKDGQKTRVNRKTNAVID